MSSFAPASIRIVLPALLSLATLAATTALTGCGAEIDRHGHVFMDVDVHQVQPGMSKDQVKGILGSPDTTNTVSGDDAFYYISTTQKTVAFLKPYEIDRQVVAVYFGGETVQDVAHYGLRDGIVVNYAKDETPARGKDMTFVEQIFGNISNRKMFKDQRQGAGGVPGPGL